MIDLFRCTHAELVALLAQWGLARVHAVRLWRYLYREELTSFADMTELPARLRAQLISEAELTLPTCRQEVHSSDGQTRKFLLELHDGRQVETVLMRYRDRLTACISSQVGCAFGCVFCATGQMGFVRHLSASEIVAQVMFLERWLRPGNEHVRNLVLMGMGEPLHNYDAVMQALEIMSDSSGLAVATKSITVSTVGVIPGIVRMADERRPYSLAVSLHAATQSAREALIVSAKAWPLNELIEACRYYARQLAKKVFIEWTVIDGENDTPQQATQLAELLQGLPAQVNLIPLNPTTGYDGHPGQRAAIVQFREILRQHGFPSTVRQRRGIDIAAGCGQLAGA